MTRFGAEQGPKTPIGPESDAIWVELGAFPGRGLTLATRPGRVIISSSEDAADRLVADLAAAVEAGAVAGGPSSSIRERTSWLSVAPRGLMASGCG